MALLDKCKIWNKLNDDTTLQNSEIGVDGVKVGTPTYTDPVKFDGGIDGAGSGTNQGTFDLSASLSGKGVALEFWVKFDVATIGMGATEVLFRQNLGSGTDLTILCFCNQNPTNALTFRIYQGTTRKVNTYPDYTWSAGSLEHWLIVFDSDDVSDRLKFYVNGVQITSYTFKSEAAWTSTNWSSNPFYIGSNGASTGQHHVDNIKFYNDVDATTISEILANRNAEGFKPAAPISVTASDGTYEDKVKILWAAGSGGASDPVSYNLYRALTSGGSYTKIISSLTQLDVDDITVTSNIKYFYKLKAVNSISEESDFSNIDSGFAQGVIVSPCDRSLPRVLFLDDEIDIYSEGFMSQILKIATKKTFKKDKLIINDIRIPVNNATDFFTPTNSNSPMNNRSWRFQALKIYDTDGELIWNGIINDVIRNHVNKKASIISMDLLKKFQNKYIVYESSGWEYPSQAAKNIMDAAGFTEYDEGSIETSNNKYEDADFKIKCNIILEAEMTLQAVLDKLGAIGCADVYTQNNKVYFRHFEEFEGGSKVNLTVADMRTTLKVSSSMNEIINNYSIAYYGDDGTPATDEDNNNIGELSRDKFGDRTLEEIDGREGSDMMIEKLSAAVYIGECNIKRTNKNHDTNPEPLTRVEFDLAGTHKDWIDLQSFFDITLTDEGWTGKPFEVFESNIDYTKSNIKIVGYEVI